MSSQIPDISYNDLLEILSNISVAVAVCNSDGRVIWVNRTLCDIVGISGDEWMGKTTRQLVEENYLDSSLVYSMFTEKKEISALVRAKNGKELVSRCRQIYDSNSIKFLVTTSTLLPELNDLRVKLEKERYRNIRYRREIEHLRDVLLIEKDFVFASPEMKSLLKDIKKVAPVDCTVLITGESGVGKEVVAKAIHSNSSRKNGPFIPLEIPSIPKSLLEAELFGYEEGAFTGSAKGGKIGLFEVAQGGTLFLDEIGDSPYDVQVKILRVIENGEIRKVGGTRGIKLDVRIIAATNRDLGRMIREGRFRDDLYYRLSTVPLKIKPLRERPEDIWPLCEHFVEKINGKYGMKKKIAGTAFDILKKYNWPGNVRELRNVVERLAIFSEDDLITLDDVKTALAVQSQHHPQEEMNGAGTPWEKYESFERARILEALKEAGGNKTKVAKMMGISRSKLYRKISRLP